MLLKQYTNLTSDLTSQIAELRAKLDKLWSHPPEDVLVVWLWDEFGVGTRHLITVGSAEEARMYDRDYFLPADQLEWLEIMESRYLLKL